MHEGKNKPSENTVMCFQPHVALLLDCCIKPIFVLPTTFEHIWFPVPSVGISLWI